MKSWKVSVKDGNGQIYHYWVDAEEKKLAEARGFRLHCGSGNWTQSGRAHVVGCVEIEGGGAA